MASERLELSCEISKADAPVRWFKDSLEVEAGHNLILEVDGAQRRLIIPITTVHDTGEYVCDTEDNSLAFLVTITGKQAYIQANYLWSIHGHSVNESSHYILHTLFLFASLRATSNANLPQRHS